MPRRVRKFGIALASVGLAIAAPRAAIAQVAHVVTATVMHVDDGDTIDVRLGDRVERVRYIGIDAPEIAHEEREGRPRRAGTREGIGAMRVNAALLVGRAVRLELDLETRDRYGRLLAYVWAGDTMVNAEMVRRGYARAMPIPPNLRYATRFAALESEARADHRGLWSRNFERLPQTRSSASSIDPRNRGAWGVRRAPPISIRSEHLHITSRPRIALVSHVRPGFPERRRARIAALRQHRHPPRSLGEQPTFGLGDKRARHAAAPPLR